MRELPWIRCNLTGTQLRQYYTQRLALSHLQMYVKADAFKLPGLRALEEQLRDMTESSINVRAYLHEGVLSVRTLVDKMDESMSEMSKK